MSVAPSRRTLPPPSLATLNPPVRGYRYFEAAPHWRFDPAAGVDDARNRWWMAEHALLAYDDDTAIDAALAAHGYAVEHLRDRASSGYAFLALAPDHALLAFRGTEVFNPGDPLRKLADVVRDWQVDARCARVPLEHGGAAHGGFARALDALWPAIEPHLGRVRRWWCTGHSLGGALAQLAALRLRAQRAPVAGVVTFGQPRCGDRSCAQRSAELPLLRVVNACDLVPRLPPPTLGFEHAGALLHLDAEQLRDYGSTLRARLRRLPQDLQHGIGALTPLALIDHAPLHYAIKCHNAVLDGLPGA
jgi:triacylglycerol lipase